MRWRAPLRQALDELRDTLSPPFEQQSGLVEPWEARDAYVDVVLGRVDPADFIREHTHSEDSAAHARAYLWLELQHHALLMYTSCGWFFDDVGRIEAVQILSYAARVLELSQQLGIDGLEEPFLRRLSEAPWNEHPGKTGADVFRELVLMRRPMVLEQR